MMQEIFFSGPCNQNSMVYNARIVVRLLRGSFGIFTSCSKKKTKHFCGIMFQVFSVFVYALKDEAHYRNNRALCRTKNNDLHKREDERWVGEEKLFECFNVGEKPHWDVLAVARLVKVLVALKRHQQLPLSVQNFHRLYLRTAKTWEMRRRWKKQHVSPSLVCVLKKSRDLRFLFR